MTPTILALAALGAPTAAALLVAIVAPARRAGWPAAVLSLAGAVVACAAAVALLVGFDTSAGPSVEVIPWLTAGGRSLADVGVRLDGVSLPMLLVVTGVALCVQVYSLGYMADEPRPAFGRYFGYQSLFLASMVLLVIAPNLLQLFAGWELVGASSYLLIGFYYRKPSAARAAVKAFWTTKLADVGLVVGLIVLLAASGGFSWQAHLEPGTATAVTLLMFVAVMGKSAQVPLHVWLPDAMEGPTPVSALLHAATMVAAGVYLVVRADPLFAQAETTRLVMAHVGALTALVAAVLATVQTDLKRVLAYSTCSQLGYMVAALGAGSAMGGFFHLTTHAAFKALLFLAAGSVIHALHTNEMPQMGGLARKMPFTTVVFVIGALALAGFPGLGGFFSKDLVLEAVAERGLWLPFGALLLAAGLTAFYVGRTLRLVFFTPSRAHDAHAHEPGPSMLIPLALLAAATVAVGFVGETIARGVGAEYHFHLGGVTIAASLIAIGGLVFALVAYRHGEAPEGLRRMSAPVMALVRARPIDRAFEFLYARVGLTLARTFAWIDRYIVDGLVNAAGALVLMGGRAVRRTQSGLAPDYVLAVASGAALLLLWGLMP